MYSKTVATNWRPDQNKITKTPVLKLFTRLRPLINVRFTIHEWLFKHGKVRLFKKTTKQIGTFNNDNVPFFRPQR